MIVLDREHLGLVDVDVERNAYGRQVASFEADLDARRVTTTPLRGVFIRAPRVRDAATDVEVLAEHDGEPVLLRDGRFLVASFHPELTDDTRVHERFLELVREESECPGIASGRRSSTRRAPPTRSAASSSPSSSRAIIVAAREGGPDPAANLALQNAIEKARVVLDAEGQHRARDREGLGCRRRRGCVRDGRLRGLRARRRRPARRGADRQPQPDGRRTCATSSRRTTATSASPVRSSGSSSGKGVILVDGAVDEDELLLAAADAGADDVERDGSSSRSYDRAREPQRGAPRARGRGLRGRVGRSSTMVPKTTVGDRGRSAARRRSLRLIDELEENDDVQDVYANFDIPERVLEEPPRPDGPVRSQRRMSFVHSRSSGTLDPAPHCLSA